MIVTVLNSSKTQNALLYGSNNKSCNLAWNNQNPIIYYITKDHIATHTILF